MTTVKKVFAAVVLTLLGTAAFAQTKPETVRIYFAPPHGTRFIRTMTIQKGLIFEDDKDPEIESIRLQHEFVWRQTARGYSLTMSPVRDSELNALARKQPGLAAVMLQNDFVFNYDVNGVFLGVSGLDRAINLARQHIPSQLKTIIEKGLPQMRQGVEQFWKDRFSLARATQQRPARIGQTWGGPISFPWGPLGPIDFTVDGRVYGWEVINGSRCLVVQTRAISEDPALTNMSALIEQTIREIISIIPLPGKQRFVKEITSQVAKLRFNGIIEESTRAIDPRTYLTCREETSRYFSFDWISGGRVQASGGTVEVHSYEFNYR